MAPKKLLNQHVAKVAGKVAKTALCTSSEGHVTAQLGANNSTQAAPNPMFSLPSTITANKAAFFDVVFDWYCKRNGECGKDAVEEEGQHSTDATSSSTSTAPNPAALLTIPWRKAPFCKDPYAIWVSEVMSQQTQLATVVRYWTAWMAKFPTVEALAAASGEEVRAVWAGMGYYRRADLLHKGAQYIVDDYRKASTSTGDDGADNNKLFPTSYEEWVKQVPGVGPYTAAAITSICFDVPATAVDGNVMRVMSRLCGTRDVDPKNPKHLALLQGVLNAGLMSGGRGRGAAAKAAVSTTVVVDDVIDLDGGDSVVDVDADSPSGDLSSPTVVLGTATTTAFLSQCPPDRRGRVNEGLMELGATVCKPNTAPNCAECPFSRPLPITFKNSNGAGDCYATTDTISTATQPLPPPVCTAYRMLQCGDIEAIDGIIPMRGSATAVKEASVDTFVVFVVGKCGAARSEGAKSEAIKAEPVDDTTTDGTSDDVVKRLRAAVDGVEVLCITRPKGGLLSEMTDFPYVETADTKGTKCGGATSKAADDNEIPAKKKGTRATKAASTPPSADRGSFTPVGSFVHIFSHIRMTVNVHVAVVDAVGEEEGPRRLLEGKALVVPTDTMFAVRLGDLSARPISQLALKSLQAALPSLPAAIVGEKVPMTATMAKQLAHDLCNRRIAGKKAGRDAD